jgi:tetratricopeptide (TPR) repeat protein
LLGAAPSGRIHEVALLTEEGIRFYSAGRYPEACQRFTEALEKEEENPALRLNLARCFERWGWQALRAGRSDESVALFRQGLRQDPDGAPLLKGLGLAAIHAGRPEEALEHLEASVRAPAGGGSGPDPETTLLLARLYDQRDQTERALGHLRRLLAADPSRPDAKALLKKLDRERQAETGYRKDESQHFVVKSRGARGLELSRVVTQILEEAADRVGRDLAFFPPEKITVILYPDERFQEVTGAHHWVNGLFDGKIRLPVGSLSGRTRALERLLTHEYAHAAVHLISKGRAPRWLQEGLAQHMEGLPHDADLQLSGGITLRGMEALLADGDLAKARTGYQISLWLVRDLLERGGIERTRQLLARLGGGEPISEALLKVYGLPMAELERQWSRLLSG